MNQPGTLSASLFARQLPQRGSQGGFLAAWLQTGIDIGGDVPDVILDGFVLGFQGGFHPADGVEDGGVVPVEFLADVGQAQVGQVPDEIHGDLPGLGDVLFLQGAPEHGFVDGIEFAHLTDDQAGGGQGVALRLEGILDHPGHIGQVQRHVVQVPVGQQLFHDAFNLAHVVGDVHRNVVAHIVPQLNAKAPGFVFQNGHSGLVVRGLDVRQQAPFKPGAQPVLQGEHIAGLPVGGHDDLLVLLVELVEGMEEFLLGGLLAGDELDIVDEEQIAFPVLAAEFHVFAAGDGGDQLVGKFIALDVDDVGFRVLPPDAVGDGVEQMGLAHAGGAVDEQGVIHLSGVFGHGDGGAVGEPVGGAHHKIIKGELGVKVHGGDGLSLVAEGVPFLVPKDQELGVGIKDFLQGILHEARTPAADNVPSEIGGGVENQVVFVQLHHLRIVEPGGNRDRSQTLLHVAEDLRPDIGG